MSAFIATNACATVTPELLGNGGLVADMQIGQSGEGQAPAGVPMDFTSALLALLVPNATPDAADSTIDSTVVQASEGEADTRSGKIPPGLDARDRSAPECLPGRVTEKRANSDREASPNLAEMAPLMVAYAVAMPDVAASQPALQPERVTEKRAKSDREASASLAEMAPLMVAYAVTMPDAAASQPAQQPEVATDAAAAPVEEVVVTPAPPAGPEPSSAAPARPSANGPLLPPPARAESTILSARATSSPEAREESQPVEASLVTQPQELVPAEVMAAEIESGGRELELAEPQPQPRTSLTRAAPTTPEIDAPQEAAEGQGPRLSPDGEERPTATKASKGVEDVATPRAAEPSQAFVDRALIELRATVSVEASESESSGSDDATPSAADGGRRTEAMQADGKRDVRPPPPVAIAEETPPMRVVTPTSQARDPLLDGLPREQSDGEARRVRAPRVKALLRLSEAQAPEPALVAPVRSGVGDSPAAVLPARVVEVSSLRYDSALLDQIRAGAVRAGQLSRVTIQLHPPELGSVAVAVESRDGRLYAHFHSTHPMVAGWLESNAPALRSQLAEAGLRLHDITLSTSTQEQSGRRDADRFPESDQRGPASSAMRDAQAPPIQSASHRARAADGLVDYFA